MSYALTPNSTAWRWVSGPDDLLPGEAHAESIYLGDNPQWDEANQTIRAPNAEERLTAARAEVCARVNAERNRREQASFAYLGKRIDSDSVSVQRITVAQATAQMALSAGVPYEIEWSCADNTMLALDAMGVLGMMQALGSYGLALHMHSRALKAQVNASEDPESIDILVGWPE